MIIAQDSIQRFINSVSPGAYASITKVDFKALDRFFIKPLGVYGSKSEIVRLLRAIAVIDDYTYALLILIMSYHENVPQGSFVACPNWWQRLFADALIWSLHSEGEYAGCC